MWHIALRCAVFVDIESVMLVETAEVIFFSIEGKLIKRRIETRDGLRDTRRN